MHAPAVLPKEGDHVGRIKAEVPESYHARRIAGKGSPGRTVPVYRSDIREDQAAARHGLYKGLCQVLPDSSLR